MFHWQMKPRLCPRKCCHNAVAINDHDDDDNPYRHDIPRLIITLWGDMAVDVGVIRHGEMTLMVKSRLILLLSHFLIANRPTRDTRIP